MMTKFCVDTFNAYYGITHATLGWIVAFIYILLHIYIYMDSCFYILYIYIQYIYIVTYMYIYG